MANATSFPPIELQSLVENAPEPIQSVETKETDRNKRIKQAAWGALASLASVGAVISGVAAVAFLFSKILMPAFNAIVTPIAYPLLKLSGFLGAFAASTALTVYSWGRVVGEFGPKAPGEKVAPALAHHAQEQKV